MSFSPACNRAVRSAIAVGWSPAGWYSETTSSGATVRCRSVTGRIGPTVRRGTDSEGVSEASPARWRQPPRSEGVSEASPARWRQPPRSEGVSEASPARWRQPPRSEGVSAASPARWRPPSSPSGDAALLDDARQVVDGGRMSDDRTGLADELRTLVDRRLVDPLGTLLESPALHPLLRHRVAGEDGECAHGPAGHDPT